MRERAITPRQRDYLRVIQGEITRRGYAPTYSDIAEPMGVSPQAVRLVVTTLQRDGYVAQEYATARSLRITDKGRAVLAQEAAAE